LNEESKYNEQKDKESSGSSRGVLSLTAIEWLGQRGKLRENHRRLKSHVTNARSDIQILFVLLIFIPN